MEVFTWKEAISGGVRLGRVGLSIGVFDGVHLGHKALLQTITRLPKSAVITFTRNPKQVLAKGTYQGDILTLDQKLAELESLGVTSTVIVDFSTEFSKLSAEIFISTVQTFVDIEILAVGRDFRCGHRGETDVTSLRRIVEKQGTRVFVVNPIFYRGREISSSRIRNAIKSGCVKSANEMLGKYHTVRLPAEIPDAIHRNADDIEIEKQSFLQILPENGTYRGAICTKSGDFLSLQRIRVTPHTISWFTNALQNGDFIRFEEAIDS